jgi:RNA polymerase sigma-70 factor (ECF subfamily)
VARDRGEFERMMLPHLDAAYTLARWLMKRREDADDVVQDAYLRALRAFDGFAGGNARPWLLAIVRNACFTALHRRSAGAKVVPIDDAQACDAADDEKWPDQIVAEREQSERLRAALAALAPIHREVLVLREIEDLSYGEIARITGVPTGTVMSRLSRARERLQAAYQAMYGAATGTDP